MRNFIALLLALPLAAGICNYEPAPSRNIGHPTTITFEDGSTYTHGKIGHAPPGWEWDCTTMGNKVCGP